MSDSSRRGYSGRAVSVKVDFPDDPARLSERGIYDGSRSRGLEANGTPAEQSRMVNEGAIGAGGKRLVWFGDGKGGAGIGMTTLEHRRETGLVVNVNGAVSGDDDDVVS